MGIFNSNGAKEAKEEKQARKERALLEKYGMQDLTDPEDYESARKIANELAGTGFMEAGIALGGGNERDILRTQLNYQRAILEQNFIMIRQLDRISRSLDTQYLEPS